MLELTQQNPDVILVFWGGILSFFSPCILPLLPVYLTHLAGTSITEAFDKKAKIRLMMNTLAFVLGISFVFIMLGLGATAIGEVLKDYQEVIRKVGGVIVILLGLNYAGILNVRFLGREKRYHLKQYEATTMKSFLLGLTFSFGWTPCLSSYLTPVLIMASVQGKVFGALSLIVVYSLGFSIPFLLLSMFSGTAINAVKGISKHLKLIKIISGVLLIIMGILLYTNLFNIFIYSY